MKYIHAFDQEGKIIGAALINSEAQIRDWEQKGFFVLPGPFIKTKNFKYTFDGEWKLSRADGQEEGVK